MASPMAELGDHDMLQGLLDHYCLKEDDVNSPVTDIHLEEISRSYCEEWNCLTPYLGMPTIVGSDVSHSATSTEKGKRYDFLTRWKHKKGRGATYKVLINALLKTESRKDAEGVCEMLQKSMQTSTQAALDSELLYECAVKCSRESIPSSNNVPKTKAQTLKIHVLSVCRAP